MTATPNDTLEFSVSADDIDEAAQFAVSQLQGWTVERSARGFTAPVLSGESFELVDGVWTRVFKFQAEFLQVVS